MKTKCAVVIFLFCVQPGCEGAQEGDLFEGDTAGTANTAGAAGNGATSAGGSTSSGGGTSAGTGGNEAGGASGDAGSSAGGTPAGGTGGSGEAGSAGDAGAANGGHGGSGQDECLSENILHPDPTCQACIHQKCCAEVQTCDEWASCSGALYCIHDRCDEDFGDFNRLDRTELVSPCFWRECAHRFAGLERYNALALCAEANCDRCMGATIDQTRP